MLVKQYISWPELVSLHWGLEYHNGYEFSRSLRLKFLRRAHRYVYKVYTMMSTVSTPWLFLEQFLCSWVWKQPWLVKRRGRCWWREVHHCRTGRCGWDRMWCSTSSPSAHIAALSSGCLQTWMLHCCWGTASQSGVETAHQGRIWGGEQTQHCSAVLSELQTHRWGSVCTFNWAAGFRSLMGSRTWRKTDFSPLSKFGLNIQF